MNFVDIYCLIVDLFSHPEENSVKNLVYDSFNFKFIKEKNHLKALMNEQEIASCLVPVDKHQFYQTVSLFIYEIQAKVAFCLHQKKKQLEKMQTYQDSFGQEKHHIQYGLLKHEYVIVVDHPNDIKIIDDSYASTQTETYSDIKLALNKWFELKYRFI